MSQTILPPGSPIIQNFLPPAGQPTGQNFLPPIGESGNSATSSTPATSAFGVTVASGNTSSQFAPQTLQALFALQADASNMQFNGSESSGSGDSTLAQNFLPPAGQQPTVQNFLPPTGGESSGSGSSTSAQNFLPPAEQQPTVQNYLPPAGQQQTQINGGENSGSGDSTSVQNFLPPAAITPASGTITSGSTATSTSNGMYAQFASQTLQTLLALQVDA